MTVETIERQAAIVTGPVITRRGASVGGGIMCLGVATMDPVEVMRRFVEQFQSEGKTEVAEELLADDFVDHCPMPGMGTDRNAVMQLFAMLRGAIPDLHVTIQRQFADGDRVATYKTFSGTHKGTFLGIPATGNSVNFDVIDIVRVTDGKMREHWNGVDSATLMQQLGVAG
ncbi:hypothetical protein AYO38_05385 [bacterium SCGC AG-212-C10]|nr:hypothetical protein AYO38_05385 [bacterium SCGC AG-212-C10]